MEGSMDPRQMDALNKRLEGLERESRWWKTLGCVALTLLGLTLLIGASGSEARKIHDEVKARRFTIVDKKGKSRGRLHLSDYGSLRLDLYDPESVLRASLYLGKRGSPALNLFDSKGKMRASLGVRSDGNPSFSLYDSEGLRAVLGRTKLETSRSRTDQERPISSLVLFDENGNVVWRAP
jgi:hypothetical protein